MDEERKREGVIFIVGDLVFMSRSYTVCLLRTLYVQLLIIYCPPVYGSSSQRKELVEIKEQFVQTNTLVFVNVG